MPRAPTFVYLRGNPLVDDQGIQDTKRSDGMNEANVDFLDSPGGYSADFTGAHANTYPESRIALDSRALIAVRQANVRFASTATPRPSPTDSARDYPRQPRNDCGALHVAAAIG